MSSAMMLSSSTTRTRVLFMASILLVAVAVGESQPYLGTHIPAGQRERRLELSRQGSHQVQPQRRGLVHVQAGGQADPIVGDRQGELAVRCRVQLDVDLALP